MKFFSWQRMAVCLAILGMATSASAETMAAQTKTVSWMDNLRGAFVGFEGLDVRGVSDNTEYYKGVFLPSVDIFNIKTYNIHPTYQWNWRVSAGINFVQNDDITLSWMQMRMRNTSTYFSPSPPIFTIPRWLLIDAWENIAGKITVDLDDVYAVWGHTMTLSPAWVMRLAAGAEYVRLNHNLKVVANVASIGFSDLGYKSKSRLNGLGPRLELDLAWRLPLPCDFRLFTNMNIALLGSQRRVTMNATNENLFLVISDMTYRHRYVVVPKAGIKLGGSFSHVMGEASQGVCCRLTTFTLELGWEAETYIHAIERSDDTTLVLLDVNRTRTENFGYQGFFVGLKINSDWL